MTDVIDEIEVVLPKLGESIHDAIVVKWLKKEGDLVTLDEPLLEVSTDKVASEIPSPVAGVLGKICVHETQKCAVGERLCLIKESAQESKKQEAVRVTPVVKKMCEQAGLDIQTLSQVIKTENNGRITKRDVEEYLNNREGREGETREPMSPLRLQIAENMIESTKIPQGYLLMQIDVTDILHKIEEKRKPFWEKTKYKLTLTPCLAKAIVQAIKHVPVMNAKYEQNAIVQREHVNLGIAVSSNHELYVPALHKAETLSLEEITIAMQKIVEKVKEKTLNTEDMQGTTITLTNFGIFGIEMGIPLVQKDQSAIIATGAIVPKLSLIDQNVQERQCMTITLSFDHRIMDGLEGCQFLQQVKKWLEKEFEKDAFFID